MRRAADLLTVSRLVLAVLLPGALWHGGALPAGLWTLGAASDWLDGRLARRAGGASRYGPVLDNAADVAFVLAGLGAAAALDVVPWLLPATIVLSVVDYARASFEVSRGMVAPSLARSRVGHAAGVANYACLGLVCAQVAWPARVPSFVLPAAILATAGLNVAAVVVRAIGRSRSAPPRRPRGG